MKKPEVNSGAPEWYTLHVPLVEPVFYGHRDGQQFQTLTSNH